MSQLIILGNGFDLACDLKSSFSNFLTWRRPQINMDDFRDPNLNAYDVVLRKHERADTQWSDIESAMQALLIDEGDGLSGVDKIYQTPCKNAFNPTTGESSSGKEPHSPLYRFTKTKTRENGGISKKELVAFLRDELSRYEESFREYLQQEVDSRGEDYTSKAKKILNAIVDDNVLKEEYQPEGGTVLSFNYTTPFSNESEPSTGLSFYNIHGTLEDDNIIFGIDGKDVGDNDLGLPFTKTYRLLSMEPLGYRSLVYPPSDEDHAPTSCIKVYGHSLAQADYSYFQMLFDAVSLYDGVAALVFYYSLYGEGTEQEKDRRIREDLYCRVMHLLISYGETFDNKVHGKNLVHKLLLEGRLIIKRIDVSSGQSAETSSDDLVA